MCADIYHTTLILAVYLFNPLPANVENTVSS